MASLGETLVKAQDQNTQGKIDFKNSLDELQKRFDTIKERRKKRDHPAWAEPGLYWNGKTWEKEFHCAYDRYSVGCYDFTGNLPKGVPRQTQMDSLFHELENTPPIDLIEDYIHEAEKWLGEQALKAKKYAVEKLKSCMKEMADRAKQKMNELFNMDEVMNDIGGEELKELLDFLWKLITGEVSLSLLGKIVENIIKLVLKMIWRTIQRMYEPYLQVIMLILWTINVVVQLLTLIVDRIAKTMELLSRIIAIQIKWPKDDLNRNTMRIAGSDPDAEAQKALQEYQQDMAYINGEITTLEMVKNQINSAAQKSNEPSLMEKAEAKATQAAEEQINTLIGNATSQLQSAVNSVLSSIPIGSIQACLAEIARITALAANIDKLIDKFAEAVGTVVTLGINKLLECMEELGISL